MLEKHFEDVLCKYPALIESGLEFIDRQINVGGKFVDLLFEDRFGQKLLVELKKGVIKREHMAQLLEYEGHFLSSENPDIRVMLIGNRVPPNISKTLDHHGFEWKRGLMHNTPPGSFLTSSQIVLGLCSGSEEGRFHKL